MKLTSSTHKLTFTLPLILFLFYACYIFLDLFSKTEIRKELPQQCHWEFDRYESSEYELEWLNIVKSDQEGATVCEGDISSSILTIAKETFNVNYNKAPFDVSNAHYFGKMHYSLKCFDEGESQNHWQSICVNSRDPCDIFCFDAKCGELQSSHNGQSKNHILTLTEAPFAISKNGELPAWSKPGKIPPWFCKNPAGCDSADAILYDLGASYFGGWSRMEGHGSVAAGGWLFNKYFMKNVHFNHYFAYEYEKLDPVKVFEQIPDELMRSYHWINIPVNATIGHKSNPWSTVQKYKLEDKVTDLVIVKLDIDTPSIENPLVDQLFINGTGKLIHEFFYEHHVSNFRLNIPMAWDIQSGTSPNLYDSYNLFLKLREMGVRSHSWP